MKTNYHLQLIHAQKSGANYETTARLAFLQAWQGWHTARQMLRMANRYNPKAKSKAMATINKQAALMRQRKAVLDRMASVKA